MRTWHLQRGSFTIEKWRFSNCKEPLLPLTFMSALLCHSIHLGWHTLKDKPVATNNHTQHARSVHVLPFFIWVCSKKPAIRPMINIIFVYHYIVLWHYVIWRKMLKFVQKSSPMICSRNRLQISNSDCSQPHLPWCASVKASSTKTRRSGTCSFTAMSPVTSTKMDIVSY